MESSAVDLDSLLDSLGDGDVDGDGEISTSPNTHHRTVDEILLSHSSSSPSPPSSPTAFYSALGGGGSTTTTAAATGGGGNSGNRADPVAYANRTKSTGRVLQQLFGSGAIRPNSKPGAALAAAAAASRSIPTPHATAIKLRRATIGSIYRSVSEATEKSVASDDSPLSPSDGAIRVSESGSAVGTHSEGFGFSVMHDSRYLEGEEITLEQFPSGSEKLDSTKADTSGEFPVDDGNFADVASNFNTLTEVVVSDQIRNIGVDEECTISTSESQKESSTKNEKNLSGINEKDQLLPCLLDEKNDEDRENCGGFQSSNNYKEGAEVNDFGEKVAEPENVGDGSLQDIVTDTCDDSVSLLSNDRNSPLNSQPSPRPFDLAEETEKKQAFTGLHYEEGVAAQPMRLEGVQKSCTVLGYFDVNHNNAITRTVSSQAFRRDHGTPQVVSVHYNYIAVGMSRGAIFIVPSKYTDHQVDSMDAKMTWLGLQGDISHVPVSSMCFNHQGDLLFAGYGDGHYTVWDVQKASALKVVTEHRAPVVHMLYLGQDTQVTRQFNVISGDSKGVVKLIRFTVVPWLNRISYSKSIKLLDETTSRVVCASPLPCGDGHGGLMGSTSSSAISTSSLSSMMGGMVDEGVVIFITHQSALVAKVSPSVEVYAQIPRPDCVREGALPYAAWRCLPQSHASMDTAAVQSSDKVSLLAIAWDQNIQIAKLLKSELKLLKKWTLESAAIGVVWLGDETLAVLTLEAQLLMFGKDGSLIHKTSLNIDGFRGDDLISYHIYFANASGNPEKAYHNSIAVRGTTMYVLGSEHLIVSRLLSWKERIEVLRKAGDWMGALNMAMALYDGQSHEVLDLPKNLNDIQRTVLPYFVELLQAYVTEVFSYMSVASLNQSVKLDQAEAIREQYIRAGGVAVEFCLHIKRPDILFEDILSKFDEANHKETFLELLEPYILKDMLGSLPPAIMQALVEHYSKKGWLQRIEQCVLHMDILSLDFNQVVRICREHGLHCALIYLFNKGLDDFTTPLEELLIVYRNSTRENAASVGYRVLVYLKYCFLGLAFPPGHGNLPHTRLPSLRKELLQFLLEPSSTQNPGTSTKLPSNGSSANVLDLLELDTEATLEVLKCAFTDDDISEPTHSPSESTNFDVESAECQKLVQKIVDILADVVGANQSHTGSSFSNDTESWPSREDIGHVYAFIAHYVACERANISRHVFHQILEYLTSESDSPDSESGNRTDTLKRREKQLLSLLQVVPEIYWDAPYVTQLSEKAQFHQVCGHIHAISHQYVAAMDSYMKVTHEPIYAFAFIHHMLRQLSKEEYNAFELAVLSRIPDLLKLSREGAYVLIIDHFSGKTQYILSELRSYPESLFLFLRTVIEVQTYGILNLSNLEKMEGFDFLGAEGTRQQSTGVQAYLEAISNFPKNLQNSRITVNDEMSEVYFELLCQFDRGSVLSFLETSESYRVEHCLRLCQEYGIIDAASFLLERVGDVGSALRLILSNLSEKFAKLDAEFHNVYPNATVDNLDSVLKSKVVAEIIEIAHACIGLCQRNSSRLQPEEAEQLWFELLDSFCEPLTDSRNARKHSEKKALKDTLNGSLDQLESEGCKYKLKFFQYPNGARIIRKLLSIFIKEIVDGMVGYVRLPQIMWKLLSDNGDQEFGDFKLTILGMLGTYDFERRILDTARSLIEDDTYYTMNLLRKGASHGYAPRSPTCCICNTVLTKNSSDPGIQVFGCGHAIHLRCELQESDTSFRGCPICVPRRKAQRLNGKSTHADGLLSRSTPQVLQTRGSSGLSPHDYESADSSHGFHQLSRFELLHNLERDKKLIQIENTNQLRLAPPALYHEKVKKGTKLLAAETSSNPASEKQRSRSLRGVKLQGSSTLFPLKSSIFGKEKIWIK